MTTASKGISVRGKSAKRSTPAALQIRNVLVAIDFSAPSLEAIEAALPLIKHFGADLHLVHVFEPDYPASSMVVRLKRSEEHTSELQSRRDLVCRLLLEKKK